MDQSRAAAAAFFLSSALLSGAAQAQSPPPVPPSQIRCADFRKLADGTYESSPTAKLGRRPFGNQVVGPPGFNFGDGKLYAVIARKCQR